MVIVRGPEYIEEIKKAPETQLSFLDEAEEVSDDLSYIRQYSNPRWAVVSRISDVWTQCRRKSISSSDTSISVHKKARHALSLTERRDCTWIRGGDPCSPERYVIVSLG